MESLVFFYSWQSDINRRHNRQFIKTAVNSAFKYFEEEFDLKLVEATDETAGSPNIRDTVLSKIRQADFFIADVTSIANVSDPESKLPKLVSNSNVMMELGYAVAYLGWNRIILICNEGYGQIELLPFDVRGHRATPYTLNDENFNDKKNIFTGLESSIKDAIGSLLKYNSVKPKILDEDIEKKERDLCELLKFLEVLGVSNIRSYFDGVGEVLNHKLLIDFDKVYDVYNDFSFQFYDEKLKKIIDKVYLNYKFIYDNDDFYYPHETQSYSRLDSRRVSEDYQKKLKEFKKSMFDNLTSFKLNLRDFCDYVRTYYLEVEINKFF
ncbi:MULTISPECIES: TIR domain-containing protein [Acinetobacter]|uniref:CD-NTase-associated protein 12/Pycsar effector protein TIR domain-containing protein n=1 Tax=Acinetobacter vivianii TaxID=1776742 RepID=N8W9M8_9GAMM|nr:MULTISPECIES: TIR domain-containing protein [Acinetobacter]ENU93588.1 hypothetical protein F971_00846 [Acinetobacter vivianii]MCU4640762.1 nucleotide-binding protein [Acinetobacter courvalinii]